MMGVSHINNDGYFNGYLDRGLMTPDEYTEYICRSDKVLREEEIKISISWYTYLEYLGIDNERLEKDRLAPDYDFNKSLWKYYQETLDRMKQWEREEAKEKSLE